MAVAAAFLLAGCITVDGGGSDEGSGGDVREQYLDLSNRFTDAFNAAAADPSGWQTDCATFARLAEEGLALPDTDSEDLNREWDAAMTAFASADTGGITGCTAAMEVGTDHIIKATEYANDL